MERRHNSGIRAIPSPPMPIASGIECVRVLVGLGWIAAHWSESECFLENGRLAIRVPLDEALSSERIAELVQLAGVAPLAFVEGLERIRRGWLSSARAK